MSRRDSTGSEELLEQLENDLREGKLEVSPEDDSDSEEEVDLKFKGIGEKRGHQTSQAREIHIRKGGKGRKRITAIEGLDGYVPFCNSDPAERKKNLKPLMQHFKRTGRAATILAPKRVPKSKISFLNPEGLIITVQGDISEEVEEYLIKELKIPPREITLHA